MEWSKENEAWWIQYKVMMPTDMKHAHRYSKEKLFLLSAQGEIKSEWEEQAVWKSYPMIV